MIFSFKLDVSELGKIIPFCGSYIDLIYNNNTVILCSEGSQSYVQLSCQALSMDIESVLSIRVNTELFYNISISGRVEVEVFDTEICISYYGVTDECVYKTLVPRQVSYVDLKSKIDIFIKSKNYESNSFAFESRIIRLASRVKSPIIIDGGFCYMYYNMSYVFTKSELPSLSCDSDLLKKSISLVNSFKIIGEFLLFEVDNVSVILQKFKVPMSSDIPLLVNEKANRVIDLDLTRVTSLTSRVKSTDYDIRISLGAGKCFINSSISKFEIPLRILSDSKNDKSLEDLIMSVGVPNKSTGSKIESIKLPYWALKMLDRAPKVKLILKRSYSILSYDKVCICVGGGIVSEEQIK